METTPTETSPATAAAAPRPRTRPFIALEHRDFRLLWFGQLVSTAGTAMQTVGINWHVWELTHSPLALGLIGLARLTPIIFFSLIGGVVADSRDRRRVMLITQTAMMLIAALLGLLTSLGVITVLAIYGLSMVSAAAVSFDNPARQALTPNLVPREHLTNALTLNSMLFQVASIVGPGLAGVMIAAFSVGSIYWINAASFLAVIVALLLMRTPAQEQLPARAASPSGLHAIREGLQFVVHQRIIFSTMMLDFFATFFSAATTLLPIFATTILNVGPVGFGILSASDSIGSVIAASVVSLLGDIKHKGVVLLAGILVYGLATVLFGVSHLFALSVLFLALVGAGDTVSTIMRSTIRQLVTPDYLRGRMTSVNMIFFMGGPQLGEVESGVAANLLGAPLSVVIGGVATLILVALTTYLVPALRNYRDIGAPPPV
jgi:MFS family permease